VQSGGQTEVPFEKGSDALEDIENGLSLRHARSKLASIPGVPSEPLSRRRRLR
jgi:hypothetical protein